MLDDDRIRKAESAVREYLAQGLLRKEESKAALPTFVANSDLSLLTAQKLLQIESESYRPYLWVLVTAYYAMFYVANAVLLREGYKVGELHSHRITSDALIVYVRHRLKRRLLQDYEKARQDASALTSTRADRLIETFEWERRNRSIFQYQMDEELKRSKALVSLERAKEFCFGMKKLLG